MQIYLAMWARGIRGNEVSAEEMSENKLYAIGVAEQLKTLLEPYHTIKCPHDDKVLNLIDDLWLETRDERLIPMAMERCYCLLDECEGIVLFHRGYMSEGMVNEENYSMVKGKFVYKASDLTEENDEGVNIKEDLILALNDWNEERTEDEELV